MSFVNKYLRNLRPYKLASHKVWTVGKEERDRILKLDWNEAAVQPSPKVAQRLRRLVDDGSFYNLYPAAYNEELMKLLCAYVGLPAENIQYFSSSDSLQEYVAKLYIAVGDPVLMVGPTYDNFRLTAEASGAIVHYYNIDDSFVFDADGFFRALDDIDPSFVYICNPNNPTGTVYEHDFIRTVLERYPNTLFLIDEAYSEFSGVTVKDLAVDHENLLISRTLSKAFALANFRFGYLIASAANTRQISGVRNPKNIPTFTQEAAIGALSDVPYMRRYVEEVHRAAEQFGKDIEKHKERLGYIHGGGNFALLQLKVLRGGGKQGVHPGLSCKERYLCTGCCTNGVPP